jgi:peptide/nickel transport system substrate-binding protein
VYQDAEGTRLSYELLAPSNRPTRLRAAELVAQDLAAVGIEARVRSMEFDALTERVWPGFDVNEGRDYDIAMWGWSPSAQLDASRYAALFHSDPAIGTLNVTGLVDPDMDALLDEMLAAQTPEERDELIGSIEERVAEVRPFVVLFYQDGAYAYRASTFDGWVFQNGQGPLGKLSLVSN